MPPQPLAPANPAEHSSALVEHGLTLIEHPDPVVALLVEVGLALTQSATLDALLQSCAQALVRHLNVAFARLWTYHETSQVLELQASAGLYTHLDGPHSRIPLGQFKIGMIAQQRQPHLTNDVLHDPRVSDKAWARREGMVAFAGYPLVLRDQLVGVMAVFAREPLPPTTLQAMGAMASNLAAGIEQKRTDQAYRYHLDLTRTITDHTSSLLIMTDEEGRTTFVNPAVEQATGYAAAELLGQVFHDMVHHSYPDGRPFPRTACPVDQALLQQIFVSGHEEAFVRKDGSFFPVRCTARPIYQDGAAIGTLLEVRDITEEKRAEAQLREQTEIAETIHRVGQVISAELDLHQAVQAVTDAATELTEAEFGSFFYNAIDDRGESYLLYTLSGVPREAFQDFPMPRSTEVFGPTFRGEGVVRLADVKQDPRYGKNAPYQGMPPGHPPVSSYLAVPVSTRSGAVVGGLFFGHSQAGVFTQRHEHIVVGLAAQAAIAIENARLYQQAQAANRAKDEFLAVVSHELRTPLNAVVGWARMLRTGKLDAETFNTALESIERNGKAQVQLVEDLLDVSRIISGKMRLDVQAVDLIQIIQAAIESVRPAAEAKAIRLQTIFDPYAGPVSGDPGRLQQVVWNLLSNGIKFTPKQGRVQVRLERVNSHVEISVSDTGLGIDPQFLGQVFERFRQADSSHTRRAGGLGLGLAIVRHLVEMHGGTVEAASGGTDQGATFTVKLPLLVLHDSQPARGDSPARRHPTAEAGVQFECPAELKGLRVLVVDDEPDARELLSFVLQECGAQVRAARSVSEALGLFEQAPPDILVSDIGMPDEDGYALIRRIRALPPERGGRVPAAALTAHASVTDRLRVLSAGFEMHIPKPVEPAELVAVIASLARRADTFNPAS